MVAVWYKLLKVQQEEEEDFMKLVLVRALLLAQMFAPFYSIFVVRICGIVNFWGLPDQFY